MLIAYILLALLAVYALLITMPLSLLRLYVTIAKYNRQARRIQRILKSLPTLSGGHSATLS